MAHFIADKGFVEEFSQTLCGGRPATLIGVEIKNKDAGILLLNNLRALSKQIQILPQTV